MSKRKFIVAANWKMNKSPEEVDSFFQQLKLPESHRDLVLVFPPALLAYLVQQSIPKTSQFQWGGQNCHFEKSGAFTGENSPELLKKTGANWVLVGHSERRNLFGESNDMLAKKVKAAQDVGLIPMLCLGETLEQRDGLKTNEVIENQLREGLKLADVTKPFAVAYEPVWAIGTGRTASLEQVRDAHSWLRKTLNSFGSQYSESTSILYGGSVTPQNCLDLSNIEDVDGFLVGGASLKPDSFSIIASCRPAPRAVEKN